MKSKKEELLSKLILLGELFLVTAVCFAVYIVFPENAGLLLVVVNICSIVYIFRVLSDMQKAKNKQHLREISAVIASIRNDLSNNVKLVSSEPVLQEFYLEIEKLREAFLQQELNRQEVLAIVDSIATNIELEKLLEDLMPKLVKVTGSNCGAFYLANHVTNNLEIKHSIGFSKNLYSEFDITLGEGFIGNIAATKQTKVLHEVPDDTVYGIRTFLGKIKPKSIMVVPIVNQDTLVGVLTMASIYDYKSNHIETIDMIKYYIGVAVGNGMTYEKTKRLTNELKFQNKLIQELNNDLEKNVLDHTIFINYILENIQDYAIYLIDIDGIIQDWNKGAENISGYKSQEVIGQHFECMYPEDIVKSGRIKSMLEVVLREGRFMESGWRTKKNGTLYYAETSIVSRSGHNGKIIGFTNVTRDITAFKKLENDLWYEKELNTKIIEGGIISLLLLNSKGKISTANSLAKDKLSVENPIDTYLRQYFKNEHEFQDTINKIVSTTIERKFEALLKKDGSTITLKISPITDKSKLTRMLLVVLL